MVWDFNAFALASLTLTILMAYRGREHVDFRNAGEVSVGMIMGIFIAVFVFANLHSEYLGLLFGVLILMSVWISIRLKSFTLGKHITYTGGIVAGTMGSMAAVGGQILALLFQNHPLESIKATLAMLYTVFSLVIFYLFGKFSYEQFVSGVMMPGFLIGYMAAPRFARYFDPKYAKTAVLAMAVAGSVLIIIKSVTDILASNSIMDS